MSRRKQVGKLSIEQLQNDPSPLLATIEEHKGDLVPSLIRGICDLTGANYEDIGGMIGLSGPQVGRIARADARSMREHNLARLIASFKLPANPLVYANAVARLPEEARRDLEEQIQHETERNRETERNQETQINLREEIADSQVLVFSFVRVDPTRFREASTPEERAKVIEQGATSSLAELAVVPEERESSVFVVQSGPAMVSEQRGAGIIPDRAVVQVELCDEAELRNGDIVLVQITKAGQQTDWATHYVYARRETPAGVFEKFEPLNSKFPHRVCHYQEGADEPLEMQRVILGRAKRIVDYGLSR